METIVKIATVVEGDDREKVLLIKEKYEKRDRPYWNVIKGTFGDNGEESVFEAAVRECREEAGVEVEITGVLGAFVYHQNGKLRIQFNFVARILEGEPKIAPLEEQKFRDESIEEVKWFSRDELSKMSSDEFISPKAHQLIQTWLAGKKYPLEMIRL